MQWQTSRFRIDLTQPRVMGIVNLTPDSFSDGGCHDDPAAGLRHAEKLLQDGADILDVGAESTRPGAPPVPLELELQRLMPWIREAVAWQVPISVDTYKPEVMAAVLDAGADIVNDIWALRQPGALAVVAAHASCGVCLMHMHRDPVSMQTQPMQGDVVEQVGHFLQERVQSTQSAGVGSDRIVIDHGIGFGKTVEQNFALLQSQSRLLSQGLPLLAGWSRKSSLGAVLSQDPSQPVPVHERVTASVAAMLLSVESGASVVRVHDVKPSVEALRVWRAARAPKIP
jgi:dihydropteroate synthase